MLKSGLLAIVFSASIWAGNDDGWSTGQAPVQSISVLEFSPAGVLFIGDSKAGHIIAVELNETPRKAPEGAPGLVDVEGKIASLMGANAGDIMIHDMAVSPISYDTYLAASRGRTKWQGSWTLPNDVDDALLLVRVTPDGSLHDVPLDNLKFAAAAIPNPVAKDKNHPWKENVSLRTEAITALQFYENRLYVAGMSNEEFSAALWILPYPFTSNVTATTVEIYHGAHGRYETDSPIRALTLYGSGMDAQVLAAYLCTPLVTFAVDNLKNAQHVKGKTVAEFGSGNFPIDMIAYELGGRQLVVMNNTNLPLIIFDPADVKNQKSITSKVASYSAGLPHTKRSGTGYLQLDRFNEKYMLGLRRMPGGSLDLQAILTERLFP